MVRLCTRTARVRSAEKALKPWCSSSWSWGPLRPVVCQPPSPGASSGTRCPPPPGRPGRGFPHRRRRRRRGMPASAFSPCSSPACRRCRCRPGRAGGRVRAGRPRPASEPGRPARRRGRRAGRLGWGRWRRSGLLRVRGDRPGFARGCGSGSRSRAQGRELLAEFDEADAFADLRSRRGSTLASA